MQLKELLATILASVVKQGDGFKISVISSDSREIKPGGIFVAVRGSTRDGHEFIANAFQNGASAVVVEDVSRVPANFSGTVIKVNHAREFLDQALSLFFGEPSKQMICIGVTGTNGKTTLTHLVEALLNAQELPTAVMGTIDHHLGPRHFPSDMTTPGPELLQKRLREFVDAGAKAVAMEVSSHALDQHRADSVSFDVAVFTNLTRDHLDYHQTMENYFYAKQRLFDDLLWKSSKFDRFAVINGDDHYGRRLKVAANVKTFYYGAKSSDFQFRILKQMYEYTEFAVVYKGKRFVIKSPMIGLHNVYNLTGAFAVAGALGLDLPTAVKTLEGFEGVRGRLQSVSNKKGVHVFVDYAHTDDALKNVLACLNEVRQQAGLKNKIITVFGCGGDRDPGKRPMMARAAEEGSDFVVATSDNPRTENPEKIIDQIMPGFSAAYMSDRVFRNASRREGIRKALELSQPGDVVLIAGKGHEDYQIIGKEKIHFDDVEVVQELFS